MTYIGNNVGDYLNGVTDRYSEVMKMVTMNTATITSLQTELHNEKCHREALEDQQIRLTQRLMTQEIILTLLLTSLALAFFWPILWVVIYFVVVSLVIAVTPWEWVDVHARRWWMWLQHEITTAVGEARELYRPEK